MEGYKDCLYTLHSRVQCCWFLLVAGGFFDCLKQQMKHGLDVATFVEEFKDILVTLLNVHFLHIKLH
jgi:hypothetical protein